MKALLLQIKALFLILFVWVVLSNNTTTAQNIFDDLSRGDGGRIIVKQEPMVERLMNAAINAGKSGRLKTQGYRIQLFSDYGPSARQNALNVRERFVSIYSSYPPERIYLSYEPPFVKLRVGDYRDENSALIDYKKFVREFPNCYIIKFEIEFPPLEE